MCTDNNCLHSPFCRIRYILDNFATVAEAVDALPGVKTIRHGLCDVGDGNEHVLGGHLVSLREQTTYARYCHFSPFSSLHDLIIIENIIQALEDATGDSAVVEHVGGSWQIYHDRENALVMTNEPSYDEQKASLATYEPWGGNITLPDNLPGSVGSADRYIRLEYFLQVSWQCI